MREFVQNYRHLDSRRVSGWFRTALCVPDPLNPGDPRNPRRCSTLLEFETPIEVERFVISSDKTPHALQRFDLQKHKVFDNLLKPRSKNMLKPRFLITFVEHVVET